MNANRRRFLVLAGTAAAVRSAPASAAGPSWEQQWTELSAAAKKEGKLSIMTVVGVGFRRWMQAAENALGIQIDLQQQNSSDNSANKILAEREASVYSFDLLVMTPITALPRLKPVGALDKLRPLLFRPDVLNDKAWPTGFNNAWADNDRVLGLPLGQTLTNPAINTDMADPKDLRGARSLLDPKWRRKILLQELKSGSTRALLTSFRLRLGEDALKQLLIDQQPTFAPDLRSIAEGLVRGNYAIAQGIAQQNVQEFQDAGLGKNVKFIDIPDVSYMSHPFTLWAVNRAPHPNAAKLFANWAFTKEGQQSYSSNLSMNAQRKDVPVGDPLQLPRPGEHYLHSSDEATFPELEKTRTLVTKITGVPA
jgi:ABC-type Fe3+ transport system substrate-binding protein